MSDKEKLQNALENIIGNVVRTRPRGWHLYPTRLRDQAVRVLKETGFEVKDYDQYETETNEITEDSI